MARHIDNTVHVKQVERVDESGGVHSMWAPSAAERWLACPLSVIQSMAMPQPKASDAAAEGTIAHGWGEKILLDDASLDDVEDESMRAGVEIYTTYVEEIFDKYENPGYEVEGRVALDQIIPGGSPSYWSCFGSADFFVYDEDDKVMPEVVDFKYGRHVVEPDNNKQLMLYAIGLVEDIGWTGPVKLTICQPRATHKDGPTRSWVVTGKQLRDLKIEARRVLSTASKSNKVAGDHCHYCLLAPTCEVKNQQIQKLAGVEFSEVEFAPMIPDSMSDTQIAIIVRHHKEIIAWVTAVVGHATTVSKKGQHIKGTKLVRNAGRGGWESDKAFAKMCKDLGIEKADAYKESPRGMGDIKKVLKEMYEDRPEDLIAEYVVKHEGSISLVAEEDSRLEYNPAASEFANK